MTRYAVDEQRAELLAVWPTGGGDLASTVAELPTGRDVHEYRAVALGMTRLSEVAWRTYTHPAEDSETAFVELGGRPQRDFGEAVSAVRRPNLPHDGVLLQPYSPLAAVAHALGRALYQLDDRALTDAVTLDVQREFEAIEQAELGDLTGRARQAVTLTRADASPLQVAEADRILYEDPFGDMRLFTDLDPTAAAVAAAHWLKAAADVTAKATDHEPDQVVVASHEIQAVPYLTPTVVLELIGNGLTPRAAVTALVREAMAAASGTVPDPAGLADVLAEALARPAEDVPGLQVRTTPLDPTRPANDLLEDLLAGIRACWVLHREYTMGGVDGPGDGGATRGAAPDAARDEGGVGAGAGAGRAIPPPTDPDDPIQAWPDIPRFLDLVRAEAGEQAGRLT